MANPRHIAKLKEGVDAWNRWRANLSSMIVSDAILTPMERSEIELIRAEFHETDLSGANLSEANLYKADLSNVNLSGTNLNGAKLFMADLSGANLTEADLTQANLRRADLNDVNLSGMNLKGVPLWMADLSGANLTEADLTQADLQKARLNWSNLKGAKLFMANLREADLSGANLEGADFNGAVVGQTLLANADLSTVRALETVRHEGPSSSIGIDTIYLSNGNIPEAFLRGAGVPDDFIAYMHSLAANPIEFYSCFISYSSKDEEFAERLHADLQSKGVRCWFAPEDLKIGDKFRTRIDESIRIYDRSWSCSQRIPCRARGLKKKSKRRLKRNVSRTSSFSSLFVWTMQSRKLSKPGQRAYVVCRTSANSASGKTTIPIRRPWGDCSAT